MDGVGVVLQGDARQLVLPDESVDLIVTSPPYFGLRDYKDGDTSLEGQIGAETTPTEFLDALWACSSEWWRVLKPGGSLWVNLGDRYSAKPNGDTNAPSVGLTKSLMGLPWRYAIGMTDGKGDPHGKGWVLRAEVIWSKPNGLPESIKDRVARKHEHWFHFTKCSHYYSAVDALREEKQHPDGPHVGKLPGSVWTIPTEPLRVPDELGVEHYAAFPSEWPRRIILGWAPTRGTCDTCKTGLAPVKEYTAKHLNRRDQDGYAPHKDGRLPPPQWKGGRNPNPATITGWKCACPPERPEGEPEPTLARAVVLDPFGGTGTTAAVAKALGCVGVSVDLSASYTKLAHWRVNGDGYHKISRKVAERGRT